MSHLHHLPQVSLIAIVQFVCRRWVLAIRPIGKEWMSLPSVIPCKLQFNLLPIYHASEWYSLVYQSLLVLSYRHLSLMLLADCFKRNTDIDYCDPKYQPRWSCMCPAVYLNTYYVERLEKEMLDKEMVTVYQEKMNPTVNCVNQRFINYLNKVNKERLDFFINEDRECQNIIFWSVSYRVAIQLRYVRYILLLINSFFSRLTLSERRCFVHVSIV